MPAERFFYPSELIVDQDVTLEDQEFHHLAHVMRLKVGDTTEVINGMGALAQASVSALSKKTATLHVNQVINASKPKREVIIAQALPRLNRLDTIIEKGTELGMTQLWLFPGDHSERKSMTPHQLERFNALCIAATKQCGRLYLPKIVLKPALSELSRTEINSFFGDLDPNAILFNEALSNMTFADILFYVGPESGFSKKELEELKGRLKAQGVRLHPNILRTDTASLVALSLITHRDAGDFN